MNYSRTSVLVCIRRYPRGFGVSWVLITPGCRKQILLGLRRLLHRHQ